MLVIHFVGTGFATEYDFVAKGAAQSEWILVIHGFITINTFVAMVFEIGVVLGGVRGIILFT